MAKETKSQRIERTHAIVSRLTAHYANARTALVFQSPLQCLIATILSAQCTDAQVNKVTPGLFRKYPDAAAFASVAQDELEQDIHSTGFYHNKAISIRKCCSAIVAKFGGKVPDSMDALLTLDGVGRKTANCVLGNAYGQPAITVDTHVKRIAWRLALTDHTDPDKIELDLQELIPRDAWLDASHMIIDHGRAICNAKRPKCDECPLADLCPKRPYPPKTANTQPNSKKS